ncbi:potassium transporter [Mycobacterium dioxanotrophicus]|uniref:Trimethylamine monooxygenase n=1 Tax=Mycobacterium dioxanotrophicus TaxID=482462 RepID=A0A1Y0CDL1_9MYCO|nr:NAD(P)/FAD-dependent oxidoreductase [Mycobacterium dioxanotrophicus]ART73045.1 potassium transporter [Mycobacterium dioxanotrophicus]
MALRVGIIGAGPSGLAQLRAFESARQKGIAIPQITCFEKQEDWGGQWNYGWRIGLDADGEPVHSSMYRHLWSNGPKECLEFADYSFDEHFGRPISSFPPRAVLVDYIKGRVEKSDVRKYVKFNTVARHTSYNADTQEFTVTVENLKTHQTETHVFDKLVVATGHFHVPAVPEFEGIKTFPGEVLHAHDFRGAERFYGKRLLMIGSSYSAEDIGMQAHKMGAASITMSYRTNPMGYDWPWNTVERPLVTRFEGNTAFFSDGTQDDFDAVVLCTGYQHKYPFLPSELSLSSPNVLYPANLYKGVVWQQNTNLFYLGAQDQYYTFNMFDAQAWFARDVMTGVIELPDYDKREADIELWLERQAALPDHDAEAEFQTDYVRELHEATDYPSFDLDAVCQLFKDWMHNKHVDILGYRDAQHRSVITGTLSEKHHTRWINALDDSMERYLNGPSQDDIHAPAGLTDRHRGGQDNTTGAGAGPSLVHHTEVLQSRPQPTHS